MSRVLVFQSPLSGRALSPGLANLYGLPPLVTLIRMY